MRLRPRRCLLALATAALAAPASALGAGWSIQPDLGGFAPAEGVPQAAMDPAGAVTLLWNRSNGFANDVQALSHPAGSGAWVDGKTLSQGGNSFSPFVVAAPDGTVSAAWRWFDGTKYRIQVASRSVGAAWGNTQTISTAGQTAYRPWLAVNDAGDVSGAWSLHDGSSPDIQTGYAPAGGSWSLGGSNLSAKSVTVETVQTGLDAFGNADYLWEAGGDVVTASRSGTGAVSGGGTLASNSSDPQIAKSANGIAVAAWVESGSALQSIRAAVKSGGPWGSPGFISDFGPFASEPCVAVDASGDAVAAWVQDESGQRSLWAATRPAAGDWSPPVRVSGPGEGAKAPDVASDPAGNAYVVWINGAGAMRASILRTIGGGGAWSAPATLSSPGQVTAEPTVAASSNGEALAAWVSSRGASATIDAAAFDSTPPVAAPDVPAAATTGQTVSVGSGARDNWSPVSASWDFGDGATAAGLGAQHVYGNPGTYTVTTRVADSVGNSTTATRSIRVTGPSLVRITTVSTAPAWRQSRLRGKLTLRGTTTLSGKATVTLRSAGSTRTIRTWSASVKPGAFSIQVTLPPNLRPGRYVTRLTVGGQSSEQPLTIPAPPEGVVSTAYIGGRLNGPAAVVLVDPPSIHAVFRFAALPKKGRRITVTWALNGRPRYTLPKARAKTIGTYISPVAPGRWTCTLKVGGRVVKIARVRVR